MYSKYKKIFNVVIITSMLVLLKLSFTPNLVQAADDLAMYSLDFEYVNDDEYMGNRQLVIRTKDKLESVDRRGFSIEENKCEIGNIQWSEFGNDIKVEIESLDPEVIDYKLVIQPETIKFQNANNKQIDPIEFDFKNYEITAGFAAIFKNIGETNTVFRNNEDKTQIKIIIDSKHIKSIRGKTISGETNNTEFIIETTDQVHSIKITTQENNFIETAQNLEYHNPRIFKTTYFNETGIKNLRIQAYDIHGKKIDSQILKYDFSNTNELNFNSELEVESEKIEYSVRDILNGVVDLDDVFRGKSYAELMNINISYPNYKGFISIDSIEELSIALSKLGQFNELDGRVVKFKLMSDLILPKNIVFAHHQSLMIDGNGHTISGGDIIVGDQANNIVKLNNINIESDIIIKGKSYLTDVIIANENKMIVENDDCSAVTLTRTLVDELKISNKEMVNIIAAQGTVIGKTDLSVGFNKNNVELTSFLGGTFDIIKLATSNKLKIIDDSNSEYTGVFKEIQIANNIVDNFINSDVARLVIGKNTTIDKLIVNDEIKLAGMEKSKILTAIAATGLEDNIINANKISIWNYKPSKKFVNVTKFVSNLTEIPLESNNLILLGGNAYNRLTSKMVNDGNAKLELILKSSETGPLNIRWADDITDQISNIAAMITSTEIDDLMGMESNMSLERSSDGKILTIYWTNIELTTNKQFEVIINPDKFMSEMFDTTIITLNAKEYSKDFKLKYAPRFKSKIDNNGYFNKFTVFIDNERMFNNSVLTTADTINSDQLKWWKSTGQGMKMIIKDVIESDVVNYYLDNTESMIYDGKYAEFSGNELRYALIGNKKVNIYVESKGYNSNDEKVLFELEPGHVYFAKNIEDSTINAALADEEIKVIHLEAGGRYGQDIPLTVGNREKRVMLVAYKNGVNDTISDLKIVETDNNFTKMLFIGIEIKKQSN